MDMNDKIEKQGYRVFDREGWVFAGCQPRICYPHSRMAAQEKRQEKGDRVGLNGYIQQKSKIVGGFYILATVS